jgi:acyl-CoA thioester hydrolase
MAALVLSGFIDLSMTRYLADAEEISMGFEAPFQSRLYKVEDQWIDYNGHFNMAYYNVLFDRAGDEVFESLGLGPDYVKSANCSFFTLEAHITYLHELHAQDEVHITTQFLDHDAKRAHYVQQMFHAAEGWLSCVTENIVMHVDMSEKKSSPFSIEVQKRLAEVQMSHKHLPVPLQVGHRIGIPRKD